MGVAVMDLTVRDIKQTVGREYVMDNHYTGGCAVGSMMWGLIPDGAADGLSKGDIERRHLVGAIAFHTPISENVRGSVWGRGECWCDHIEDDHGFHQHVTELHRLVTNDFLIGTATSWFVSQALDRLKAYKPKYWGVLSFADSTEGHDGTVYQATNAIYTGMTGESTYYRAPDGTLKPPRNGIEGNISHDDARAKEWEIEKRKAKHRYLFLLPDGTRHRRWMEDNLQFEQEPYPSNEVPALAD